MGREIVKPLRVDVGQRRLLHMATEEAFLCFVGLRFCATNGGIKAGKSRIDGLNIFRRILRDKQRSREER